MSSEPILPEPLIPYAVQLAEVRREIAMRERVYPRFVADGGLTQRQASQRLDAMRATAELLALLVRWESPELLPADGAADPIGAVAEAARELLDARDACGGDGFIDDVPENAKRIERVQAAWRDLRGALIKAGKS